MPHNTFTIPRARASHATSISRKSGRSAPAKTHELEAESLGCGLMSFALDGQLANEGQCPMRRRLDAHRRRLGTVVWHAVRGIRSFKAKARQLLFQLFSIILTFLSGHGFTSLIYSSLDTPTSCKLSSLLPFSTSILNTILFSFPRKKDSYPPQGGGRSGLVGLGHT